MDELAMIQCAGPAWWCPARSCPPPPLYSFSVSPGWVDTRQGWYTFDWRYPKQRSPRDWSQENKAPTPDLLVRSCLAELRASTFPSISVFNSCISWNSIIVPTYIIIINLHLGNLCNINVNILTHKLPGCFGGHLRNPASKWIRWKFLLKEKYEGM